MQDLYDQRGPGAARRSLYAELADLVLTSFVIGALFTPLIWYVQTLATRYGGNMSVLQLAFGEWLCVVTFIALPLFALAHLKIRWHHHKDPDYLS